MTTQNEIFPDTQTKKGAKPDWIVKTPPINGTGKKLERIGAAWNREDGGICIRLTGTQVISRDVYLSRLKTTANPDPAGGAGHHSAAMRGYLGAARI